MIEPRVLQGGRQVPPIGTPRASGAIWWWSIMMGFIYGIIIFGVIFL